ncbi:hypothetical protein BUALT_Bualt02G0123000 [Buddleja alternifolia]|uniref:protein-serine/threonine phosphatase n=1 Tax=Buddleja alternifolia TaxID=168488 RepID=A0AAV6YAP1_9LAMI|nr:hypothetical protein BUALT_Bualt02G0123000 [Buddleja alternifolia]
MMEEISPAVSVTLSLGNPLSENSGISTQMEITRIELVTDASLILNGNSGSSWDVRYGCVNPENGLIHNAQASEEDEIISSVELIPLDSTSDISVPIDVALDATVPIAVQIDGQIVAKVISFEERSVRRKLSDDVLKITECSNEPTIKASVVAVKLSSEKDPNKDGVKSVFELDYVPLWGSVSICGHRPEMEDAVMAAPHFMKIPIDMFVGDRGDGISQSLSHLNSHFFGVYDGHGGSQVANYCRDRIHLALVEELKNVKDDLVKGSARDTRQVQWEKIFTSCFVKVDDEVAGKVSKGVPEGDADACNRTSDPVAPETVGSTAVVAVICSSHIIVANSGDSRAVLYRGKEAISLSVDHKPNREDEYARIEASGGKVIQWNGHRVFGVLAMSRSIGRSMRFYEALLHALYFSHVFPSPESSVHDGSEMSSKSWLSSEPSIRDGLTWVPSPGDRYLKPWIIPEPEVMFMPRAREDECLVLASDGLWDVMTNEEVCYVARKRILIWHKKNGTNPLTGRGIGVDPAAQAAAEYLSNLALQKGSKDNISVIVVDLKAQRKFKSKS